MPPKIAGVLCGVIVPSAEMEVSILPRKRPLPISISRAEVETLHSGSIQKRWLLHHRWGNAVERQAESVDSVYRSKNCFVARGDFQTVNFRVLAKPVLLSSRKDPQRIGLWRFPRLMSNHECLVNGVDGTAKAEVALRDCHQRLERLININEPLGNRFLNRIHVVADYKTVVRLFEQANAAQQDVCQIQR